MTLIKKKEVIIKTYEVLYRPVRKILTIKIEGKDAGFMELGNSDWFYIVDKEDEIIFSVPEDSVISWKLIEKRTVETPKLLEMKA